jgi:hypothetical protein
VRDHSVIEDLWASSTPDQKEADDVPEERGGGTHDQEKGLDEH